MQPILVGNIGQWILKPLLGVFLAKFMVPFLGLPQAVATGIILVRIDTSL